MSKLVETLRTGDWITPQRLRLWALAVLVASLAGLGFLIATSHGLNDFKGRPLGTDFSNIYVGGAYALDGEAVAAFDLDQQYARAQAIFGPDTPFYSWCYPPFLMFVAAPLALLPYIPALLLWQASTMALYLGMLFMVLRSVKLRPEDGDGALARQPLWLLLAVASPAVFVNIYHGHNGFLTAALIGAALVQLDRRPILAGLLIGLLSYKPQFGVMIPLVLMLSGRWRVFASAALTVLALSLLATLTFGSEIWRAFFDSMAWSRVIGLEQGGTGWHKIQSVFAWVRMWGGGVALAYAIQGVVAVALAISLGWLWRSRAAFPLQAAALIIASILATPYSMDYDLVALAPAIALLAAYGFSRGFAPWEKSALVAIWLVPLVGRGFAEQTLIPLGVTSMLLLYALVMARAAADLGLLRRRQPVAQPAG
jgi:hypothetical protein